MGRHQRPARVRARRLRRVARAARGRRRSTSTTSTASTATRRSRRPSGAMAELVEAGKVRYLGLSEAAAATDPPRARGASDHGAPVRVLALDPRPRGGRILPLARELGIGFVPYSPLGRGFLTGAIKSRRRSRTQDDFRRQQPALPGREPRRRTSSSSSGSRRSRPRRASRRRSSRSPGCMAQGDDIVPIPGTKRVRYLEENAAAADDRALRRRPCAASTRRSRRARPPATATPT